MKHLVKILPALAALIITAGCAKKSQPVALNEQKTILYAEFMHEVNSFNPVITYERDFKADHLFFGNDVIESAKAEGNQLAGFLTAVDELGGGMVTTIPLVHAKSMSGGPVDSTFYQRIKSTILEGVRTNPGAAGIYLSLHGAMGVQGMFDPEGEIIKAIREITTPDFVISVSFDLHANNTVRRAENADIIVGYHTNPHRDHFKTAYKATELLLRTVAGEIDPVMVVTKMKLLKGGGMNIDLLPPFRQIFRTMKQMEKEEGVLSVSFFPVHIWIDDPELGYSTIAITDGNAELAGAKAALIADMAWEARTVPQPDGLTPHEAIEKARKKRLARALGTVVFCDISDAVGTGTPGESTWILNALVEHGPELRSYISVRDEQAALQAWGYGVGDSVSLLLGGKIDTIYNKTISYSGEIIFREETSLGKTVIVKHDGIHVIVSELPMAGRFPSDYKELGLNLMKADIIVVKNLFPFRYRFLLYNRKTMNIITPGLSNINPEELHYQHIPRPIYPLDEIETW
jgi:microcystin degradation protein MlrC